MSMVRDAGRFWSKVKLGKNDECWPWLKSTSGFGYGQFWSGSSTVGAHRFAWSLYNGEIPDGMCICHTCDNPGCCNPLHLFLGTHADNTADMIAKGRGGSKKTKRNLCDLEIHYAQILFENGFSQDGIATTFKTTISHARDIVRNRRLPPLSEMMA